MEPALVLQYEYNPPRSQGEGEFREKLEKNLPKIKVACCACLSG